MQDADHILIPLLNGQFAVAQVVKTDHSTANIFLSLRLANKTSTQKVLSTQDIVAALTVTIAPLPNGHWPIVGYDTIPAFDGEWSASAPHDPAVVEALANACHGLYPWDGFPDAAFFSNMLWHGDIRPPKALLKSQMDLP